MNKKGFTLVEMLVVIAIIAVLVAIIVPTAVGETKKAAAATDAANLRSVLAQINTWYLTNDAKLESSSKFTATAESTTIKFDSADTQIKVPTCKTSSTDFFKVEFDGQEFTVYFGNNDIDHYAGIAGGTSSN